MRTYLGSLLTLLAATTALADTVDFDTTGSTLSCNGVAGCVQNTATAVTIGGNTITYTAVSSTGLTPSVFNPIGLGSIATSGTGGGASVSGLQLLLNIHSTPPGLSGTMPGTLSGTFASSGSTATIAFPPANSGSPLFCFCFGIQISGGGHDYLYQIQSSSWNLPENSQTSFTGYVLEDSGARLHPSANTTPQFAPVNTAFPNALSLVAIEEGISGETPASGITVTFNAPLPSGASGLFDNNSTTDMATTGADGSAALTFTANATAGGPYAVVASTPPINSLNHFPDLVFTLTNTPAAVADLSATISDGTMFVQGGKPNLYTIVIHNAGPSDVVGATVSDVLPANLVDGIWECTPDAGATCTASSSGNINDSVNLPNGKSVTYALSATVVAIPEVAVHNTVTVTSPISVPDSAMLNNSATDVDNVGIFFNGFE